MIKLINNIAKHAFTIVFCAIATTSASRNGLDADPVKAQFYSDATPEELSNFVKAYFSLGARYPLSYIGAFFGLSAPVVAPVPGIGILGQGFTGWNLSFDDNRVMTWEIEETAPLVTGIDTMISALKSVPILNLLFMACLYCWWMPLVLLFFALRNRLHMGLVFVPLFIVTGFCLISPTFQWRYAFPLLLLSPVLMPLAVSIAMSTFKKRSEKAMAQLDTNTQSA